MDEQLTQEVPLKDLSNRMKTIGYEYSKKPVVYQYEKELYEDNPQIVFPKKARVWEEKSRDYWYEQCLISEITLKTQAEIQVEKLQKDLDHLSPRCKRPSKS